MQISEIIVDFDAIKAFVNDHKETSLAPADFDELIIEAAQLVKGYDETLIRRLLYMEISYPDRVRNPLMSSMYRDDGSARYRGISQASMDFWIDSVAERYPAYPRPESSPLSMQLMAPLLYVNRYKRQVITAKNGKKVSIGSLPMMADVFYGIHQQGPSGFVNYITGSTTLIGNQSDVSKVALRNVKAML